MKEAVKVEVVSGRMYYRVHRHILITPHLLKRAEERGIRAGEVIRKLSEESELLINTVSRFMEKGYVRGFLFLTFPSGIKGKVIWELSSNGQRLESIEEALECTDVDIVFYTYLKEEHRFFKETLNSYKRRRKKY